MNTNLNNPTSFKEEIIANLKDNENRPKETKLTYAQIAKRIGCSIDTVKHYQRQEVKEILRLESQKLSLNKFDKISAENQLNKIKNKIHTLTSFDFPFLVINKTLVDKYKMSLAVFLSYQRRDEQGNFLCCISLKPINFSSKLYAIGKCKRTGLLMIYLKKYGMLFNMQDDELIEVCKAVLSIREVKKATVPIEKTSAF